MNMLNLPKKVYFKRGAMNVAFGELAAVYNFKRAFIVSDANLYVAGACAPVVEFLRAKNIRSAEFFTISEVPTYADVMSAMPKMNEFEPDVIIAIGGGAVISAAKAMWIKYENPDVELSSLPSKLTGTDTNFPVMGKKAKLAVVATSFATGAQSSPFAVLADDAGKKAVIASYTLLPELSVTDSLFAESMPADMIKKSGITLISQAIRAYAAPGANAYTEGLLVVVADAVLKNLEAAINGCVDAMYSLCNAGNIAGYAVGNAVDTIDPEAVAYPTAKEKGADDAKVEAMAKELGLADAEALIAAVEKLAAL